MERRLRSAVLSNHTHTSVCDGVVSTTTSISSSSSIPTSHPNDFEPSANAIEENNSSILRDWLSSSSHLTVNQMPSSQMPSSHRHEHLPRSLPQPAGGGNPIFERIGFCWTIPHPSHQPPLSSNSRGETGLPPSSPPRPTQHQHLWKTLSETQTSEEHLLRKTFQCLLHLTRQETVFVTSTMEWKFCNGFVGIKRIKEKQALLEIDKLRNALQLSDSTHLVPVSLESDTREMFLIRRQPKLAAQKHIQVEAALQTFLNKQFSNKHSAATNAKSTSSASTNISSQPTFSENLQKHMQETWYCHIINTIVSSQTNQTNLQQNAQIRQVSLQRTFIFPLFPFQNTTNTNTSNSNSVGNNNDGDNGEKNTRNKPLNTQQWSIHLDCTWFADMFEDEEENEEEEKEQADKTNLVSSSDILSTCMFRALILYNNVFLKPHPDLVQVKLVAGCVAQSCGKPNPGGGSSTLEEKDKPFSEYTEKILLLVEQIHKSLYLSTSFS